jgi:hypothetical protein
LHGTAEHVDRIVRDFRRCKEVEELGREAQQQASRKISWFYDSEGMLNIKTRLPAEAGQMFIKAMNAACEEISSPEVSAETPNVKLPLDPPTRKADALALVAETFLAQGAATLKGGNRHQMHIDHHTAATRWDGGSCDYSVAVESLLSRWRRSLPA